MLRFLRGAAAPLLALSLSACADDSPPPEDALPSTPDAAAPAPSVTSSSRPPPGNGGVQPIDVDCPTGSAVEVEPNATVAQATSLGAALALCGAITPGDDVDYSTFTTPEGKKLDVFQAVIDGAVDFDLEVNGKTLKPSEVKKFEAGTYVVKAYAKDGKPARYRYRIQYEP